MENEKPLYLLAVTHQEEVMIILHHTVQSGETCYYPEKSQISLKTQQIKIGKMKLRLQSFQRPITGF